MPGITSKKKELKPVHPTEPNPDLLHMPKAQFIENRRLENERKLKEKEFSAGLKKEEKVTAKKPKDIK